MNVDNSPGSKHAEVRLYNPMVILTYYVLGGLPLGSLLYGINLSRRGNRVMGNILTILFGLTYILILILIAKRINVITLRLLSIFIGINVMKIEWNPYKEAIDKGAIPAKWWHPLLVAFAIFISIIYSYSFC
ncbi:MAG: hypothetical protein ABIE07_05395 [Candidatus Zixiibacteriota bacterium]